MARIGFNIAHLKRLLRLEDEFMTRDLNDHVIYRCPLKSWAGLTMADVYRRYQLWALEPATAADSEEVDCFRQFGADIRDEGEFFLMLLKHFDRDIYWHYVSANRDPAVIKQLLAESAADPGISTTAVPMSPIWRFMTVIFGR